MPRSTAPKSTSTQLKQVFDTLHENGVSIISVIALMQLDEATQKLIDSPTMNALEVDEWFSHVVDCIQALSIQPHQLAVWLPKELIERVYEQV